MAKTVLTAFLQETDAWLWLDWANSVYSQVRALSEPPARLACQQSHGFMRTKFPNYINPYQSFLPEMQLFCATDSVPSARSSSLFCRCHGSMRSLPPRNRWPVSSVALPQQAGYYLEGPFRHCTEAALSRRGEIGFEPPLGGAAKALASNILNRGADSRHLAAGAGPDFRHRCSLAHSIYALPRSGPLLLTEQPSRPHSLMPPPSFNTMQHSNVNGAVGRFDRANRWQVRPSRDKRRSDALCVGPPLAMCKHSCKTMCKPGRYSVSIAAGGGQRRLSGPATGQPDPIDVRAGCGSGHAEIYWVTRGRPAIRRARTRARDTRARPGAKASPSRPAPLRRNISAPAGAALPVRSLATPRRSAPQLRRNAPQCG